MTRPAASSPAPVPPSARGPLALGLAGIIVALTGATVVCLAIITLAYPGATRMHARPWSLAYINALLLPAFVLLLRAFDFIRPLVLPSIGWLALALGTAATILFSAYLSPYQPQALLWSSPLLFGVIVFLVAYDWLHRSPGRTPVRRERLLLALFSFLAVAGLVSLVLWYRVARTLPTTEMFAARNLAPLGHPNYTAGLALLLLPIAVTLVRRRRGRWQMTAAAGVLVALAMLFTSGSRGGLIGLAVLVLAAWIAAPLSRRKKWQVALIGGLAALGFAFAHPRTRAMLLPAPGSAAPNISNVQRAAMFTAGSRMGLDRPLLGWGPGPTPLAFPRYRAELEGGAENVLQLHSLPIQLWAELGAAGLICLAGFVILLVRAARVDAAIVVALVGYGCFALTDWQLDVPVFTAALALLAAAAAPPATLAVSPKFGYAIGGLTVACLLLLLGLARRDPVPSLNVRALALARDPGRAAEASGLLEESLRLNGDQEIAHFNLGWLRVVANPSAAEQHFLAAVHLVPDKGGAYFGLGLARLNQGRRDEAAHAFAMEALNDPSFQFSPWWREPAIAALRDPAATEYSRLLEAVASALPADSWAKTQVTGLREHTDRFGRVAPGPEKNFRRERTGYPVLMRNLDLPPPSDLFDVREPATPPEKLPPKGWLPSPLLLSLLDSPPAGMGRK
jgi:O-antigen ligase